MFLPIPERQILDCSKLKEFKNLKFDENCKDFFAKVEKYCGKMRNCSLRAISPFPKVFSKDKYSRHVKTKAGLGKGYQQSFQTRQVSNNSSGKDN